MNADDGYHSGRPVRMTRLIGDLMKTIKERKKQSGIRYDNAPRPFEKTSTTNVEADDVSRRFNYVCEEWTPHS